MLSLKEEISGFQKQIQKLDLSTYTSLFQNMAISHNQPSLREVVSENNFLVETVKMMGSVFLNYCWLNERVYSKITQHQLGLHDEQARLAAITQAVQRKLDDSLRSFKIIHEDSVSQNRRNREVVEVGLKSICQEIQTKVTDAQLNQKIRQILRKYDQGDLLDENEGETLNQSSDITSLSPRQEKRNSERKTGKVAYEDHYRLQEEMERQMTKLSRQNHEIEQAGQQSKEGVAHCAALLSLHQTEIKRIRSDMTRLQGEQKCSVQLLQEDIMKITQKLQTIISEDEWRRRMALFEARSIDPLKEQLAEGLQQLKNELKRVKEQTYLKTNSTEAQMQQLGKQVADFRAKVAKQVEDVAVLQLKFNQMEQRVHQETIEANLSINNFMQQSKKSSKQLQKTVKKEVAELRSNIQKLSTTVQDKAFKAISKKIESSFQCFEGDMIETRELIRNLSTSLALANEELTDMKDLLSKKANFSDVVHYIQSKADKLDISQMRTRLNTNTQSHPVMVRQLSETTTTRQNPSQSPRKLNRPKPPHTEFIAPATHRAQSRKADLEGTARRLLIRDTKKGVMKSYGSLINDLRK